LFANPWLLLSLTCIFWAGNIVAARTAIDNISPMTLVTGRWAITCAILALTARRAFVADLPVLNQHWLRIIMMGLIGFTGYHTLYYVSAHYTQGVNLAILQGVTPVYVFFGAWLLWRTQVRAWQAIGCVFTIIGVLLIGTHGDLATITSLRFNLGDSGILLASVFYAIYSLSLRNRPAASSFGFFFALAIAAFLTSLPLFVWEIARGETLWPTPKGWIVLGYVALFPTLLAQVFFIRSVEIVGPGRATLFYNMTPALGAVMATTFLGEPIAPYHVVALMFVIGGVMMAERLGRK
jgi:drug/metabolite transporter (DMT)-like permease